MNLDAFVVILFRWIHVSTACVAAGSVFFMRVVLPSALGAVGADPARAVLLRQAGV